jgi:hypothetical protein
MHTSCFRVITSIPVQGTVYVKVYLVLLGLLTCILTCHNSVSFHNPRPIRLRPSTPGLYNYKHSNQLPRDQRSESDGMTSFAKLFHKCLRYWNSKVHHCNFTWSSASSVSISPSHYTSLSYIVMLFSHSI